MTASTSLSLRSDLKICDDRDLCPCSRRGGQQHLQVAGLGLPADEAEHAPVQAAEQLGGPLEVGVVTAFDPGTSSSMAEKTSRRNSSAGGAVTPWRRSA